MAVTGKALVTREFFDANVPDLDGSQTISGAWTFSQAIGTGLSDSRVALGANHGTIGIESSVLGVDAQAPDGQSAAFGCQAGFGGSGEGRSVFGYNAGQGAATARQSAFGRQAGQLNTGSRQHAFGYLAGRDNSGNFQSSFGYNAGRNNIGLDQSAFGYEAGFNNQGDEQTVMGYLAGKTNTGQWQTAVGHGAGESNTAERQTALGYQAGRNNTGVATLALGHLAGLGNDRNNRMILHVSTTAVNLTDPLLDGRFTSGTDPDDFAYVKGLKVNGLLEATDSFVLTSPDATRWKVTVDDTGTLQVASTTEEITP